MLAAHTAPPLRRLLRLSAVHITHTRESGHVSVSTPSLLVLHILSSHPYVSKTTIQGSDKKSKRHKTLKKKLSKQSISAECTLWLFWVHSNYLPHSNTCAVQDQGEEREKNPKLLWNMPSLYISMCIQVLSVWECVPGMLSCTREEKHCHVTKKLKHLEVLPTRLFLLQFFLLPDLLPILTFQKTAFEHFLLLL